MTSDWILLAGAALSAFPAILYCWNSFLFRRPSRGGHAEHRCVSVLIPARNEERGIAACVRSVLASEGVELEVIVLDDHSEDNTAEEVRSIGDSRVRVESAPPLPPGWNGKQHACSVLASLARHDLLCFIDADLRLEQAAIADTVRFLERSRAGLVSGFPRQETGGFLDALLLPLINWLLLGYLPIIGMRWTRLPMFGAGCGQFFLGTREAYEASGGHAEIRDSMHDGVALPRVFRRAGFHTDLFDATRLATCRMYWSDRAVWNGFAKNAHEGLGSAAGIVPWTVLLLGSLLIPLWILPRLHGAIRFRQSLWSAAAHPLAVLLLVAIQWYALARRSAGSPVPWKGRIHTSSSSATA